MNILLFGHLQDIVGTGVCGVEHVKDTESLINLLVQQYPALADAQFVIAVNKQMVQTNTPLMENAEIALLPPFSGG